MKNGRHDGEHHNGRDEVNNENSNASERQTNGEIQTKSEENGDEASRKKDDDKKDKDSKSK